MHLKRLFVFFLFVLTISCNKSEQFIGVTDLNTSYQLYAFTTVQNSNFDISIDDTTWNDLVYTSSGTLNNILSYTKKLTNSDYSRVKIVWNDSVTILDSSIKLKSINKIYVIQLNSNLSPTVLFNFGDNNAQAPTTGKVKVRIFYNKDLSDNTPIPDSIEVKFFKLVGAYPNVISTEDTTIFLMKGIVSNYFELPDCFLKENNMDVHLGYQLINPSNNNIIQDYCIQYNYGIIEFSSNIGGNYQTASFDYYQDAQGCNFGSPEEEYKLKLLIKSN